MNSFRIVLLGILIAGFVSGCKKETTPPPVEVVPTVMIAVQPTYNGANLHLDSTYTTAEGYLVQFTDIKFYLEDVRNGSTVMTDAMLFDFRERGTELFNGKGDASKFSGLSANLGVAAGINHNDPSAFDNSSWLNIANSNDMHWDWNPGYIFVKIEGKVDTIPDANVLLDKTFVFHCGLDENLQTVQFDNLNWIQTGDHSHKLTLQLDMATFLQGASQSIDLKTENSSHAAPGQEALTLKVMQNFREALTP